MKQYYTVRTTNLFESRLEEIKTFYILHGFLDITLKLNNVVINCVEQLELFPKSNPVSVFHKNEMYRKYVNGNFVIVYEIDDIKKEVSLLVISHQREDYLNIHI